MPVWYAYGTCVCVQCNITGQAAMSCPAIKQNAAEASNALCKSFCGLCGMFVDATYKSRAS